MTANLSISHLRRALRKTEKALDQMRSERNRFQDDRLLLACLAADGPCFSKPLKAVAAKKLRDEILREELGLNPDGTPCHADVLLELANAEKGAKQ